MELLAAPPAELVAIADPSARGAAPLLDSASAGSRGPPTALPFDLLLGRLTEALPGGESWPVGGKKLPLPQLDVAPETPALAGVLASAASAVPQLLAAIAGATAAPKSSAAAGTPVLPATRDPSAATPVLPPLAGTAEQTPLSNAEQQSFFAELAVPAEPAPVAEAFHAESVGSADSGTASAVETGNFERLFSNDARVRAQVAAAAAAEPRAATPAAPGASATNPAPGLHRLPAQEGTPAPRSGIRRLDSLGSIAAPPTTGEALGSADWLPAHVHAHNTAGTAAAAPSTAAAPQAPVDARLPDWHEAFAQRVQWLVDTDAGEARIKLNPPELGAVDVKISLVDDKTHVHLTAATAAARDELAQALPRLRELFTVSGLELGSATVHDGRGSGHAYGGGEHARHGDDTAHEAALAPLDGLFDEPASSPRGLARGRIDVFA